MEQYRESRQQMARRERDPPTYPCPQCRKPVLDQRPPIPLYLSSHCSDPEHDVTKIGEREARIAQLESEKAIFDPARVAQLDAQVHQMQGEMEALVNAYAVLVDQCHSHPSPLSSSTNLAQVAQLEAQVLQLEGEKQVLIDANKALEDRSMASSSSSSRPPLPRPSPRLAASQQNKFRAQQKQLVEMAKELTMLKAQVANGRR